MKPKRITLPMFYLLLTLIDGERHGYAMGNEVRERSGGKVELGPASLYWTINRLEEAGLVEEADDVDDEIEDAAERDGRAKRRRYYRLTAAGRDVLEEETEIWSDVVAFARSKNVGAQEVR